jgi:uncharacterized protein (TIGR03382 family)
MVYVTYTMPDMRTLTLGLAAAVAVVAPARAGGLNDPACVPSPAHPRPVVLVHGQGATVEMFEELGIVGLLTSRGYCVYGVSHGRDDSGRHGRAHLAVSAAEIEGFIERVRGNTGAKRVDVISHSAGTGVVANMLLANQRADMIHRAISFGGLHHPYAHVDIGQDMNLFVPSLVVTARQIDPNVDAQVVIANAINLYTSAGGPLFGVDAELAASDFVADLFEPTYWVALHGGLSEPAGTHLVPGRNARTLATEDSDPRVCYTNIVGIADPLTGASAGFQDDAPNVDNFLLETRADHVQILTDPAAQARMFAALDAPCDATPTGDDTGDGSGDGGDSSDNDGDGPFSAGCSASHGASASWLVVLALAGVARRRRRR